LRQPINQSGFRPDIKLEKNIFEGVGMADRRHLERFDLKLPAMLEIISNCGEHNKKVINLITSNACSGGAFFDTDQPLPEGTDVKIELVLSIDKLKKIKGKQDISGLHPGELSVLELAKIMKIKEVINNG